jgi:cytosine deaminase
MSSEDLLGVEEAIRQAQQSYDEGGIPVGSVLMLDGRIISSGHNQRVQNEDPIAHGEMDCLRAAGRRRSYPRTTLFTTLSPCMMCAGTVVQFKIPRVVIGDAINFGGNEEFLRQRGVTVEILNDPRCVELMARFIKEKPSLWNEDIAEE